MAEEFRGYFQTTLKSVEDLEGIIITDRDGVVILEATKSDFPQNLSKSTFLASFGVAREKANKVGYGNNKSVAAFYSGHQVIQLNFYPLVVTLVGNAEANTGVLYSVENDIKGAMKDLIQAIGWE